MGSTCAPSVIVSSPLIWSRTSTKPIAKAPSKPGFRQIEKTSFPSTTLVEASTLRLISATDSFPALKIVQHRCAKLPSIWYSSPGLLYTSTVTLDRPIIDDLLTLKIGFWPSDLSPLNPSHRWCRLGLCETIKKWFELTQLVDSVYHSTNCISEEYPFLFFFLNKIHLFHIWNKVPKLIIPINGHWKI